MHTVVELPEFRRAANQWLTAEAIAELVAHLAGNPESGVLLRGTGGIRKLRWGTAAKGKSGGVRAVYYYHSQHMPLFLLTLFGKGEKANLSEVERNELAKLVNILKRNYSR